jgi:hypothetical protein
MNAPNESQQINDPINEQPSRVVEKWWRGPRTFVLWSIMMLVITWVELMALVIGLGLLAEKKYLLGALAVTGGLVLAISILRRLFLRGYLRRFIFGFVCLATLIALSYTEENWRGKNAWETYKHELEAQGEQLDWKAGIPARVPDEQNFINTPLLQAIGYKDKVDKKIMERLSFDFGSDFVKGIDGKFTDFKGFQDRLRTNRFWQKGKGWIENTRTDLPPRPENPAADVLTVFQKIEPEAKELRQASQRPYAQFAVEGNPFEVSVPNFVACRTLVQMFSLRACAELALGQPDEAFQDIRVIHRLADALGSNPILVSVMIRVAITGVGMESFWEGLAGRQWSDAQLEEFQRYFQSIDLLKDLDNSWRMGERNAVNNIAEGLLRDEFLGTKKDAKSIFEAALEKIAASAIPTGWIYQNKLVYTRMMQSSSSTWNAREQKVLPRKVDGFESVLNEFFSHRSPFKLLAGIGIPNFTKAVRTAAQNQTFANEAMLACALERYHRAQGEFPETLNSLMPKFINSIPSDIVGGGEALKYRRTTDGKYILYSVGWDEKDNGGTPATNTAGQEGDWAWPFPEKK